MSVVIYNDVQLKIVRTARWDSRTIYTEDSCDPVVIHHHFGFECIFNQAATTTSDTELPIQAMNVLRDKLLTPRRRLTIANEVGHIGMDVAGEDPFEEQQALDARNGPRPIACNIYRIIGEKTMVVYWECEVYIPFKCPDKDTSILVHRWEHSHDIDQLNYTTRTISGQAVFNTERLRKGDQLPDDFRSQFFHELPPHMVRQNVRVTQHSDGCTFSYQITDREVPFSVGRSVKWTDGLVYANPILKIQGRYTQGYVDEKWIGFANRYNSMTVEVWGIRTCPRAYLVSAAIKAALPYGFPIGLYTQDLNPGFSADITVDLTEKYAMFRVGYTTGGGMLRSTLGGGPFDLINNFPEDKLKYAVQYAEFTPQAIRDSMMSQAMRDLMITLGLPAPGGGLPDKPAPTDNPPLVNDNGSRGTFLEKLIAQRLMYPCELPRNPDRRMIEDTDITKSLIFGV